MDLPHDVMPVSTKDTAARSNKVEIQEDLERIQVAMAKLCKRSCRQRVFEEMQAAHEKGICVRQRELAKMREALEHEQQRRLVETGAYAWCVRVCVREREHACECVHLVCVCVCVCQRTLQAAGASERGVVEGLGFRV